MGKDSQKYFDQHGFPAEVARKFVQFLVGMSSALTRDFRAK